MANQKTAAIVACATTNFLVMLTLLPLAAILPTIAGHFGVSAETSGWVQTAYLLALTSSLLISGRLGDLYGHRKVYMIGIILFTASGTMSGFVQDFGVLIAFRLLQGVGAALITGNSLAIVTNSFKPEERGTAIGIIGMATSLGVIIGVVVSTSLAQYLNWQWLFYLTLPVGLLCILAARHLRADSRSIAPPKIDYLGGIALAATLVAFSLAFSHWHSGGATSPDGWRYHGGLLVATAVGLLLFVIAERRASQPLIELSYLLNAPFSFSIIANLLLHMTMMASSFLMPFLLEKGLGLPPSHTAGVMISISAGSILGLPLSGRIYDRTKWKFFCPLVMIAVSLGLAIMALFAPTWPYFMLLVISFALGFTTGFFNTPNNVIIMSTAPADLRGFAAGMLETSRQFGHTLGVGATSAVFGAALLAMPVGTPTSTAYIIGYQQACLVASGVAFLGILASLVHPLWGRERAAALPEPAAS